MKQMGLLVRPVSFCGALTLWTWRDEYYNAHSAVTITDDYGNAVEVWTYFPHGLENVLWH